MKAIVIGTAIAVVLAATLTLASGRSPDAVVMLSDCLTSEDVLRHAERSRNGIPLSCNEERRLRNLQREALR